MTNDNWKGSQQAQIQGSGYAPPNDAESAVAITLAAGNYTAILSGKNNTYRPFLRSVLNAGIHVRKQWEEATGRGALRRIQIGFRMSARTDSRQYKYSGLCCFFRRLKGKSYARNRCDKNKTTVNALVEVSAVISRDRKT